MLLRLSRIEIKPRQQKPLHCLPPAMLAQIFANVIFYTGLCLFYLLFPIVYLITIWLRSSTKRKSSSKDLVIGIFHPYWYLEFSILISSVLSVALC